MRLVAWSLTLVTCAACGPRVIAPNGQAKPDTVRDHVVLRGGSKLYSAPSQSSEVYAFALRTSADSDDSDTSFDLALKVEEDRGEWLRVVRGGDDCLSSLDAGYDVALWVRTKDLRSVTTRKITNRYEDGTSVEIAPGTPLAGGATPDGLVIRDRRQVSMRVEIPSDASGARYALAPHATETRLASIKPNDAWLRVCDALPYGGRFAILPGEAIPVVARSLDEGRANDGRRVVAYQGGCASFRLRVPDASIVMMAVESTSNTLGSEPLLRCDGASPSNSYSRLGTTRLRQFKVDAGTAVYWPDRAPAGRVTADAIVSSPSEHDGRWCFPWSFATGDAEAVGELCTLQPPTERAP